jgi:LuxR family glucitol operon transcriptional activator
MALANVAEIFYQAGLKVLMVDWDLEAPGLERFFPVELGDILKRPGVIEILLDYKTRMSQENAIFDETQSILNLEEFLINVYPEKSAKGELWLLTAGKRDGQFFTDYATTVRSFDWRDFYQNWEGELFFDWLRKDLEKRVDIVLIDSRTGVTEMGGVCTYQFADIVIMFCAPNQQNIDGIWRMANDFTSDKVQSLRKGRKLDVLIVPARVEDRAETELLNRFRSQFTEEFDKFIPGTLSERLQSLWELKIPYVPYYSFDESIVVSGPEGSLSEDMAAAFTILANAILKNEHKTIQIGISKKHISNANSTNFSNTNSKKFGRLITQGLYHWASQQDKSIKAVQNEIASEMGLTTSAIDYWRRGHIPIKSDNVASLIRYFVKNGTLNKDWATDFLNAAEYLETTTLLEELFPSAKKDQGKSILLHNLPQPNFARFIGREEVFNHIYELLKPYPRSRIFLISINGIGGIGKSALALEVAYHYIRDYNNIPLDERFDTILWFSAKQFILSAYGITTRQQSFKTLDDIYTIIAVLCQREDIIRAKPEKQHELIKKVLTNQRTLLIVDNIESIGEDALLEFLREIPAPTKAIITSRQKMDVAYPVHLQGLSWQEAELLIKLETESRGLNISSSDTRKLYLRTGGVPLAIVWSIAQVSLGYSVDTILNRLAQPTSDLLRFSFEHSLQMISGQPAHKVLMAASISETDISRDCLGYICQLEEWDRDEGVASLVKLSLLNYHANRFSLFPLTRMLAQSELQKHADFEKIAMDRFVKWYQDICQTYDLSLDNNERINQEWNNILVSAKWCADQNRHGDVVKFWKKINLPAYLHGYWQELYEGCDFIIKGSIERKDWQIASEYATIQGNLLIQMEQYVEAESILSSVLEHTDNIGLDAIVRLLLVLAHVYIRKKQFKKAQSFIKDAEIKLFECMKLQSMECREEIQDFKYIQSLYYYATRNYSCAKELIQQMILEGCNNISQLRLSIMAKYLLALIALDEGDKSDAEKLIKENLLELEKCKDHLQIAYHKLKLAELESERQNYTEANILAYDAKDIFERLGLLNISTAAKKYIQVNVSG